MNVLPILKSDDTYKRIKLQIDSEKINWEDNIKDIDDLREMFVFNTNFNLAIVDIKIFWKDEAVELLEKFNVPILYFEGDYEEIINKVLKVIPKEPVIEEVPEEKEEVPEDDRPVRYIEKPIYIEKTREVEVPRYKEIYTSIPKKTIFVGNLSKRAGSTFISTNLARMLSYNNILSLVIEHPLSAPYLFDYVGIYTKLQKLKDSEEDIIYYSYQHEISKGKKIEKDKEFIDDGIIWMAADPREEKIKEFDYYKMMKLLYATKKPNITIFDCGDKLSDTKTKELYSEADMILVIIDPMPSDILLNMKLLEEYIALKEDKGFPIEFVINKYTDGIKLKDLKDILDIKPLSYIPAIDTELIHREIYKLRLPFDNEDIKSELENPLYYILNKFIPAEYWTNTEIKQKENIFTTFKNLITKSKEKLKDKGD